MNKGNYSRDPHRHFSHRKRFGFFLSILLSNRNGEDTVGMAYLGLLTENFNLRGTP
jgi:hypothetical protein